MATAAEQNLMQQGMSQAQGPDIFKMAMLQKQQQGGQQARRTATPGTGVDIIDIFTAPGRREAQGEINAAEDASLLQQQNQLAQQQAGNIMAASGVDFGRLGAGPTQGFQGLLKDPTTRQAGLNMLSQVSQSQAPMTAIQQSALAKSQIEVAQAALDFQRSQGIGMSPELMSSTANMLFDDRQREMNPYTTRLGNYDQLMALGDMQNGPASMAGLFKFISSMDDSVVRDSEGKLLSSSSGPVGELVNYFNQVSGQGFFAPEMATAIRNTATELAQSTWQTADRINTDHDKRLAAFSNQYQTPALMQLGVGTGFNSERQFDASTQAPAAQAPAALPPNLADDLPGFKAD